MAKKTILLPLYVKDHAHDHGVEACRKKGITGSAVTQSAIYKKAFSDYCVEYHESASVGIKPNPWSPTISKRVFALIPQLFSDDSIVWKNVTESERKSLSQSLKSSVNNMARIFAYTTCGLHQYDPEKSPEKWDRGYLVPKGATGEQMKTVYLNRYVRLFIALKIVKGMTTPEKADSILTMTKQSIMNELARFGVSEKSTVRDLTDPKIRDQIVKLVLA